MKKTLIFLFVSLSKISFSQFDYKEMKDTLCPSFCGIRDSATLSEIYPALINLDTTKISKGLSEYYSDLSRVQYEMCLINKSDKSMLKLSLVSAEKSIYHNPRDFEMLWNVGFYYKTLGDCEKALSYLKRYRKVCPKRYWKENKDQISLFLNDCPCEEMTDQ